MAKITITFEDTTDSNGDPEIDASFNYGEIITEETTLTVAQTACQVIQNTVNNLVSYATQKHHNKQLKEMLIDGVEPTEPINNPIINNHTKH